MNSNYSNNARLETSKEESQTACKLCSQIFMTWEEYENHMLNSQAHVFCCDICLIDFRQYATYKRHREHMHPLDQNLKCKTCGKSFPRLGGLIGHYESSQCKSITENQLESVRKQKLQIYDSQKDTSNFQNFDCNPSSSKDKNPRPMDECPDTDEDLISFNDRIVTWDYVPKAKNPHVQTLPSSSVFQMRHDEEEGGVSLVTNNSTETTLDPYSPQFRAENFFVPLLMKFKCPHRFCGKSFENRPAFMRHMKSQTHRSRELQCRGCLKYFGSATALIQHSESQSLRCRIRELPDYEQVVDIMTSGVATVAGRLRDNSVAYATTKSGLVSKENPQRNEEW
ncbi:putative c2h2 finger domain-containing protein [Golovinomyces cichoracearum]|uniref:Putative c2h2 finger domain-containing protein n=1 Tax=Golovinomyces cichoracearum TaxID=62708 RepID=A0A420HCV7_9PEZI|nr:putative c2h2 finger domain-containing protein [Golovinomyces cichoracearum]